MIYRFEYIALNKKMACEYKYKYQAEANKKDIEGYEGVYASGIQVINENRDPKPSPFAIEGK